MSTHAIAARLPRRRPSARSRPIGDALAVTWRNLVVLGRTPQLLVFATIQPLIFVLLFRYVFGGSIHVPGVDSACARCRWRGAPCSQGARRPTSSATSWSWP